MSFRTSLTKSPTKEKKWENASPVTYPSWTRNSNWLAMPTLADTEQQINLLLAVYNITSGNTVSFSCAGAYTVDWGDGTSNNYATGVTASHLYDFANTSLTTTSETYKQAMIVITPQAGNNITSFNMTTKPAGFAAGMPLNYLDIQVVAPNMTASGLTVVSNVIPTSSTTNYPVLEHANIQKINSNANINLGFSYCKSLCQVDFGSSVYLQNLALYFANCSSLVAVNGIKLSPNASAIQAFENCSSLVVAPYIGNFSNLTNSCASMYSGCRNLRVFPQDWGDLSANTSGNFSNFFSNCSSLEYAPFIKMPATTNISPSAFFSGCVSLKFVPHYNTSNFTSANGLFSGCELLTEIPKFDFSKVVDCSSMFSGCRSLVKVPPLNVPLSTTFNNMFANCSNLVDMPEITSGTALTNTVSMFASCVSLKNTTSFNTVNVTSVQSMFSGCSNLEYVPDNQYNLVNCSNFANMLQNCISLAHAPELTTTAATSMSAMFSGSSSMLTVPLYDLNGVTTTATMFSNCNALTEIPAFNMSTVTTTTSMFQNCFSLREIPTMTMNSGATYTTTFSSCSGLTRNRMTGINATVSMAQQNLGATELNEIYTNLSATGSGKTITVTGNWGTATDTPSIATAKGWTVTG